MRNIFQSKIINVLYLLIVVSLLSGGYWVWCSQLTDDHEAHVILWYLICAELVFIGSLLTVTLWMVKRKMINSGTIAFASVFLILTFVILIVLFGIYENFSRYGV